MNPKTKILVVDDDPGTRTAISAVINEADRSVVCVGSGEEAFKALLANDFAVILLDVSMPGINGFETASLIRDREASRQIPILFLTGSESGPKGKSERGQRFTSHWGDDSLLPLKK